MIEIRRITPSSLARIVALLSATLYVLTGVLVSLLWGVSRSFLSGNFPGASLSALSLLLLWLAGVVLVALVSYLIGLLAAVIYNALARWWGGLQVDLVRLGHEADEPTPEKTKKNRGK